MKKRAAKGQKRRESTVVPAIPLAFEDAVARLVKAKPQRVRKTKQSRKER